MASTRPALMFLAIAACNREPSLASRAAELGLWVPPEPGLTIVEEQRPTEQLTIVSAKSAGRSARLYIWALADAGAAAEELSAQQAMLRSVFEPRLPPYPEFLTRESACPEPFKPRERPHPLGRAALLYAGERLGFGVCADELVRYRAEVVFLQCPGGRHAFRLEQFVAPDAPWSDLTTFTDAIHCSRG